MIWILFVILNCGSDSKFDNFFEGCWRSWWWGKQVATMVETSAERAFLCSMQVACWFTQEWVQYVLFGLYEWCSLLTLSQLPQRSSCYSGLLIVTTIEFIKVVWFQLLFVVVLLPFDTFIVFLFLLSEKPSLLLWIWSFCCFQFLLNQLSINSHLLFVTTTHRWFRLDVCSMFDTCWCQTPTFDVGVCH